MKKKSINTQLVHAGKLKDEFGSVVTPIYQTSTFSYKSVDDGAALFKGSGEGYIYTRLANPTINALEEKLAVLEDGHGAIAVSSGMAAITTTYATLLKQGDHIVSSSAVYGASRGAMESIFANFGIASSYVDTSDKNLVNEAIRPETRLIYLETPANPTLRLTDIEGISRLARSKDILVAVDNTFCSPYLQKPLDLGADVSLHSMTKFINGHADVVGGCIVAKSKELYERLRQTMVLLGCNMDPHQAFLVDRGIKTMALRIDKAQFNAMKIAQFLETHPEVQWVNYPGLESFQQKELAEKQMSGPGALMSFGLKGGYDAGKDLMNAVNLAALAVSLGSVETLIQHPASMSHVGLSKSAREVAGITDDMVRLSVGIEDVEDIIGDLNSALGQVKKNKLETAFN